MKGTEESQGMDIPLILWVDDQPEFIRQLSILLSAAGMSMNIEVATSSEEAERKLEATRYSAIVADLCLDEYDRASNSGAQLLAKLSRTARHLPKFTFSGNNSDPTYQADLEEAHIIASADKETRIPRSGVGEVLFFRELYKWARNHAEVVNIDPERIAFEKYLGDPDKYRDAVMSHWAKHGGWITDELSKLGYAWGVVCGTAIVSGSPDLFDFPDEVEIKEIGRLHNLVPFAYSLPTPVETITWIPTKFPEDRFPRIAIKLSTLLHDDFDTGAMQTHVSSDLVGLSIFDSLRPGSHLGMPHKSATKRVKVTLVADDGVERTEVMPLVVVTDWDTSGFVKVNGLRKVLVGRDILRAFPVEITLNSKTGKSGMRFV
jgi:CheY-like chemotaxis protein